uniref:tRNA(Ile)-lysidine synthase, chloroplastic n=1 Tax=Helminthora furcellata TaxID=1884666 RepID=A0A1G4NQZ0_9FLOR|nr:tRNA Ile-lysidine synthetase [Helminthora furcellata]SCW21087.1 tRNA Ile-lysidine synthetase [Helminthora furcellata]SCW23947.1 tRNA Ile-lysidine synthetase [Helminthora furcellata]
MTSFLHKKLIHNLYQRLKIRNNCSILLAISCGQDSLCLLKLFIDLAKTNNLHLAIVHIDHQWRQDTTINTQHMVNLIKNINLPSYLYQLHPRTYSEAEFRTMRYQIYLKTAQKYSFDIIATAHTSSDKTETCLMNMIQGGNIDTLNSLRWDRNIHKNINLIRPLLNFNRAEINWFCKYYALPIWFDYTNIYYQCKRNRIRHELIPYLKQYYQTDIEKQIELFLEKTSSDTDYLRQTTIKIYQSIKHPIYIAFNYKLLLQQHKSMQLRVLQLFFTHNTKIKYSYRILDTLLEKLREMQGTQDIKNGLIIQTSKNWAYLI